MRSASSQIAGPGLAGVLVSAITAPYVLTPPSVAVPLLIVSTLLVSFGVVLFNIPGISLYQTLVPDRLLGRMNASGRIVWGVLPLGSLFGGVLASAIGVRATLFVGAGLSTVAFVFLLAKPIRSIATVDGDARAPGDGGLAAPAG